MKSWQKPRDTTGKNRSKLPPTPHSNNVGFNCCFSPRCSLVHFPSQQVQATRASYEYIWERESGGERTRTLATCHCHYSNEALRSPPMTSRNSWECRPRTVGRPRRLDRQWCGCGWDQRRFTESESRARTRRAIWGEWLGGGAWVKDTSLFQSHSAVYTYIGVRTRGVSYAWM